ncbi:hypothetical protein [Marinicrinis lubricantis]|uniref:Uncharacterized protein n=1 Tax=Marinicrinis lubricantis TaxID=2086470 RepID=A0ABW1ILH5_9BACL
MEKKQRKKQLKPVQTDSSKLLHRNEEQAAEAPSVNLQTPMYELPAAEQPNPNVGMMPNMPVYESPAGMMPNVPMFEAPASHMMPNAPMFEAPASHMMPNAPMFEAPASHMMPNVPMFEAPVSHMMPMHHANPKPYEGCHPCQQHAMMHPHMTMPLSVFPGVNPAPVQTAPIMHEPNPNPNINPYPSFVAPASMNPAPMNALPQQVLPIANANHMPPQLAMPYSGNAPANMYPQYTSPITNMPNEPEYTLPLMENNKPMMSSPYEIPLENENAYELPFANAFPHTENVEPDQVLPLAENNKPNPTMPEVTFTEASKKVKPWVDRGIEESHSVSYPQVLTEVSMKSYLTGIGYDDETVANIVEAWKKEDRF